MTYACSQGNIIFDLQKTLFRKSSKMINFYFSECSGSDVGGSAGGCWSE